MRFGPVPLDEALGQILGHNVIDRAGRRLLRKGRALSEADLEQLRALGRETVWTAQIESSDVLEDEAARLTTEAAVCGAVRLAGPSTGRVNVHATALGVVQVAVDTLHRLNECTGITLATLPEHSVVREGRMVGTTKILPYAVPRELLERAVSIARESGPVLRVAALPRRSVGLVVSASEATLERVTEGFARALGQRLENLGSSLDQTRSLVHRDDAGGTEGLMAGAIREQIEGGADLVLLAGETAIQDAADHAPRAVELAGGEVLSFGAPVDPGNLLMLGRVGSTPVVGAPGCARSPKRNIVDLVLPRLLLGEQLTARDLTALGHGGLLEDVAERPLPRRRIESEASDAGGS